MKNKELETAATIIGAGCVGILAAVVILIIVLS